LGISSYEPCTTHCFQGPDFHAERQAIWAAYYENDNLDLTGAEMFITGHVMCCTTCCQAMFEEGIVYAGSLDSGKSYSRGTDTLV
jgi:tRNA(Arg) A34 adenosine deaminase TadA